MFKVYSRRSIAVEHVFEIDIFKDLDYFVLITYCFECAILDVCNSLVSVLLNRVSVIKPMFYINSCFLI